MKKKEKKCKTKKKRGRENTPAISVEEQERLDAEALLERHARLAEDWSSSDDDVLSCIRTCKCKTSYGTRCSRLVGPNNPTKYCLMHLKSQATKQDRKIVKLKRRYKRKRMSRQEGIQRLLPYQTTLDRLNAVIDQVEDAQDESSVDEDFMYDSAEDDDTVDASTVAPAPVATAPPPLNPLSSSSSPSSSSPPSSLFAKMNIRERGD
ncbi:hypothetical protein [Campylobacter jejuni]|uniref:hypothetical protein n=1 Tax=Campylobacter jejuni TaxID=197 RepID=UPI001E4EA424|nr:hypothetical protein [Campylobacter jejuni]